jgi:hypothetical protein
LAPPGDEIFSVQAVALELFRHRILVVDDELDALA